MSEYETVVEDLNAGIKLKEKSTASPLKVKGHPGLSFSFVFFCYQKDCG
jgi:hypothetical protein